MNAEQQIDRELSNSRGFTVIVRCDKSTRWMISEVEFANQIQALVRAAAKVWTAGAEPGVIVMLGTPITHDEH